MGIQKLKVQEFGVQNDPKIGSMSPQFSTTLEIGTVSLKFNLHPNPMVNFQENKQKTRFWPHKGPKGGKWGPDKPQL